MILTAQIKAIDLAKGTCKVHIPQFDLPNSTSPAILEAYICTLPGIYNGYNIDDSVWVVFEKNLIDSPVVLGHLGVPNICENAAGGAIKGKSLTISERVMLPKDVEFNTAETDFNSIAKIIAKLKTLSENTGSTGDLPTTLNNLQNTLDALDIRLKNIERNGFPDTPTPEPEPEPTPDLDIEDYIKNHPLNTYIPFNGDITDKKGHTTSSSGTLIFNKENYFGQSVTLGEGYVILNDFNPGSNSFTVAFWINPNTIATSYDPCIFSNQNWSRGGNVGITLAMTAENLVLNLGNGYQALKCIAQHSADYTGNWMHVIAIVDRATNKLSLISNFDYEHNRVTIDLAPEWRMDFTTQYSFNIGQDGTGRYQYPLNASINEFVIFDGAFTQADVNSLKTYYNNKTN